MIDADARRSRMVCDQLEARGIGSPPLLEAMRRVPRERFVEPAFAESAFDDGPLPIGEGQTISQPYIVAAMIEAAAVGAADVVLEVGAGSGYAAAVLARLAARVCAIERHEVLAAAARLRLESLGCGNVDLRCGDGTLGWPEPDTRFDVILVSAAGPEVPPSLQAQLAAGGRLVMPVGERGWQRLVRLVRGGDGRFEREELSAVAFVPLIGAEGWAGDDWRRPGA